MKNNETIEHIDSKNESTTSESTEENIRRGKVAMDVAHLPSSYEPTIKEISESETQAIISQTVIKHRQYFEEYFREIIPPKYSIGEIDGASVYLSDLLQTRHTHVMVYVKTEDENQFHPRMFYRSGSSMLWRFLPLIKNKYYDKTSYGENAINAPIKLQSAIENLYFKQPDRIIKSSSDSIIAPRDPNIVYGDSNNGCDISHYVTKRVIGGKESLTPGYYVKESYSDSDKTPTVVLADPEECSVSDRLSPDFDHILQTWETSSSLYGDTIARCFQSKDGSLEYLIFQNHDGGSWVGGIECASARVTSTGLRTEFIEPGSLTTPLYEYHIPGMVYQDGRKSGGFWGNPNMIKGSYIRMDDYTSRIPMLREFNQRYGK